MSRPRTYDHDAIAADYEAGEKLSVIMARHGCTQGMPRWIAKLRGLRSRGQARRKTVILPPFPWRRRG